MNPLISVIVPVYNHARTIKSCLNSVLAQTYRPTEIIVIDDGSIDNFNQEISAFANFEVLILKQENRGAPAARNRGFAESKGEYVIFWDADTMAKPDLLQKMFDALRKNPSASYAYSKFKFGWKTMRGHQFAPELLKKANYIDVTSLMRRADFLGFDESLKKFQDWDLWLAMLEKNKTGVFVPEVLYKKVVGNRRGISSWLPRFLYKFSGLKRARKYNDAKKIIFIKHKL